MISATGFYIIYHQTAFEFQLFFTFGFYIQRQEKEEKWENTANLKDFDFLLDSPFHQYSRLWF